MRHDLRLCPWAAWLAAVVAACLAGPNTPAPAQTLEERIAGLVSRVQPLDTNTLPPGKFSPPARYFTTPDGYLRFLSAAAGFHLPPTEGSNNPPALIARAFVTQNAPLLGVNSPQVTFEPFKIRTGTNHTTVRLQQAYAGIPIFGAEVNVQVNPRGGIRNASSDIERNVQLLDGGTLSTAPTLAATGIVATVTAQAAARYPGAVFTTSQPALMIFAPSVLGCEGNLRLVWLVDTACRTITGLNQRLLIDAHNGQTVRAYPRRYPALDRRISDANNTDSGTLIRSEGDPPSGNADVDDAYFFMADVYNFYSSQHERDSFDGGGKKIEVTVRYCNPGDPCPWPNACYDPNVREFFFGAGYTVDDVVAHEFTHGVTDYESELKYENASGAMSESFSDIWGEFVDLCNGHGNDDPTNRWYFGEDLAGGADRYMKDPTWEHDPDCRSSPYYVPAVSNPDLTNDLGGVHSNSGVCNKLCYLLTDGDTFNGWTVTGLGIPRTANLFYEVQVNLLNSGADWTDLCLALSEAGVNLGWSVGSRNNLYYAFKAVGIAQEQDAYVDGDGSNLIQSGSESHPFHTLEQGVDYVYPGDHIHLHAGSYNEKLVIEKAMELVPQSGSVVLGQ